MIFSKILLGRRLGGASWQESIRKAVSISGCALMVTGCANLNSIYRNKTVIDDQANSLRAVTTDARQRSVLVSSRTDGIRVCAEQAPDVFAVLSAGANAQGSLQGAKGDPAASAQIAAAMSEQASAIQRTQTVNLLAQSFYRTCERWLSGAIDGDEFIVQSMRDQRTMMVVLAIEQLTGAVRTPSAVVISAGPASATSDTKTAQQLAEAKKKADDRAADLPKKQAAFDKALAEAPAPAAGKSKSCDDFSDAAKKSECQKAKDDLDAAKKLSDREEAFYQALLKSEGGGSASAGATVAAASPVQSAPSAEAIAKVAEAVTAIVDKGLQFNEYDAVCGVILRNGPGSTPELRDVYSRCLDRNAPPQKAMVEAPEMASLRPPTKNLAVSSPRFRARLFPHTATAAQTDGMRQLDAALDAIPGLTTYGVQNVGSDAVDETQIRYFFAEDKAAAAFLSGQLAGNLNPAPACKALLSYGQRGVVSRGLLELWVAKNAVIANPGALSPGKAGPGCSE